MLLSRNNSDTDFAVPHRVLRRTSLDHVLTGSGSKPFAIAHLSSVALPPQEPTRAVIFSVQGVARCPERPLLLFSRDPPIAFAGGPPQEAGQARGTAATTHLGISVLIISGGRQGLSPLREDR